MKLTVAKKVEQTAESLHEKRQRLGRRSKNKGSNYERVIAKKFKTAFGFEFVRTPQSGGFAKNNAKAGDFRGDIIPADESVDSLIHVECKNTKTWSLPAWLKQARGDCPKGKIPVVIFHQHGTSEDFITLSLEGFFDLINKGHILVNKG